MSSIRPLITIAIIVAAGVFMFTKINEGPAPVPPAADQALELAPGADIPPLSTAGAPAWQDPPSSAPSSDAATPPTAPPMTLSAENPPTTAPAEKIEVPKTADVPPIPDLPPMTVAPATTAEKTAPRATETPAPLSAANAEPATSAAATDTTPTEPTAASDAVSQPPAVEPESSAASSDDRYGVAQGAAAAVTQPAPTAAPAVEAPVASPTAPTPKFADAWPEIRAALERQELVAAHEMLSRWYGNPTLTPEEAQQVELLLSQLAGTVVYSTEHRLEPPYTVRQGDTLLTIAQQYDVPWELLAKINGIPAANMVQPGQQLKVVHGPFTALVELDKRQLTLQLNGRYAGRFSITVAPEVTVGVGQWVLEQKLVNPTAAVSGVVSASYSPAPVDHVLVLHSESPGPGPATISITAGPGSPSGPTAVAPSAIRLAPRDVEEVADILSVGSHVTIRR